MLGRFLIVGGIGFVIDVGVTYLLIAAGSDPPLARLPAVCAAAFATWLMNRRYTFRSEDPDRVGELIRYALVAGVGMLINLGVYWTCLALGAAPLAGVVFGSIVQFGFSFTAYRVFAFRRVRVKTAR